jgi:hypothetical protein
MSRSRRRNAIKIDGFYSDSKKRKFTDSVRGVSRPLDVQWFESNLEFSYEEIYPPPKWPSHPKRKGYRPRNPAIIDLDQVPKGWSDLEPDLRPE